MTTETVVAPLESLVRLLQSDLEEEVEACLQRKRYERIYGATGYRSNYLPERKITLGSGGVPIRAQVFSRLADQRLGLYKLTTSSPAPARHFPEG